MPKIEITEDQLAYVEALREELQSDVAGRYATVRTVDAVQYLIDNHDGALDQTVEDARPAAGGVGAVGQGAVGDGAADDGGAGSGVGDALDSALESDGADADEGGANDAGEPSADGGASAAGATGSDASAAAPAPGPGAAAGGDGSDDGMLSAMMQLLETHDDKWTAADGDTGYQVELPDGSTESANTRDDVRALLFKHYE